MRSIALPNAQLIPVIKQLIDEGHTATFRIRGFSMRPFLEDMRDKAVISPAVAENLKKGDVVLAEIAPQVYVLHRIVGREQNTLTLRGDGNVRGTETCQVGNVIGIATGFIRGNCIKPCLTNGLAWRMYSFVWPSSAFLRRLLLAFHRRVILRVQGMKH